MFKKYLENRLEIIRDTHNLNINFIDTELDTNMILCISFLLEKFCRDQKIKGKESFFTRGYTGIMHLCYCTYPFIVHQEGELDLIELVKNYQLDFLKK